MSNVFKNFCLKNRKAVVYTSTALIGASLIGGGSYFAYSRIENHKEQKEALRIEQEKIAEEERLAAEKAAREEYIANNKIAYLTFDDGPHPKNTPIVLDVLKKNGIKATFFLVGEMVDNNPELVKRIQEEGHTIANHTYKHKYSYPTKEDFLSAIESTDESISKALGTEHKSLFVRVPGGSMGKPKLQGFLDENGYKDTNWTALDGDSEKGGKVSTEYVLNRIDSTVGDDKYEVVLMHDIKSVTANNLQTIIDKIKEKGYVFEKLDETSPIKLH